MGPFFGYYTSPRALIFARAKDSIKSFGLFVLFEMTRLLPFKIPEIDVYFSCVFFFLFSFSLESLKGILTFAQRDHAKHFELCHEVIFEFNINSNSLFDVN